MAVYFWINSGGGSPAGNWSDNNNWSFTDGGSAAGSYPDGTDDTAIIGYAATGSILEMGGFSGTIGLFLVLSSSYTLDLTNSESYNSLSFNLGLFYGSGSGPINSALTGPCIFRGSGASNAYYVGGDAYFIGSGCTNNGQVTGSAYFTNSGGAINNTGGSVGGLAVFNGGSWESKGLLTGPAVFYGQGSGTSRLHSGSVTGALIPLSPFTNTGTAGKYPLDILGTGI